MQVTGMDTCIFVLPVPELSANLKLVFDVFFGNTTVIPPSCIVCHMTVTCMTSISYYTSLVGQMSLYNFPSPFHLLLHH